MPVWLPKPSVVVVRRYTNTPSIPQGISKLLYLDASTLSGGASSIRFPLDSLHIWRLLLYSKTKVLLPHEEEVMGSKVYPHTQKVLWKSSKEENHLSDPVSLSLLTSTLHTLIEEGIQTEEGSGYTELGYNPALQLLQDYNQARAQLECMLGELAHKYDNLRIKLAKNHEWKGVIMAQEGNAAFQEVFTIASPAESIKLLPW